MATKKITLNGNLSQISLAAKEYIGRRERITHPAGEFDSAKRFYLSEPVAKSVRTPSRVWPNSQMVHGRTLAHVSHVYKVDAKDVRKVANYADKNNIDYIEMDNTLAHQILTKNQSIIAFEKAQKEIEKYNQKSALKIAVVPAVEGKMYSNNAINNQNKIDWKTQGTSADNQTKDDIKLDAELETKFKISENDLLTKESNKNIAENYKEGLSDAKDKTFIEIIGKNKYAENWSKSFKTSIAFHA
ncbi:MAG: hypothetical protein WAX04_01610, partial [Oscillospiraceae bacterium]